MMDAEDKSLSLVEIIFTKSLYLFNTQRGLRGDA